MPRTVWSRQHVTTALTLVATGGWLMSLVARTFIHDFSAQGVDAVMLVIVGFWFATNTKMNGMNGAGS